MDISSSLTGKRSFVFLAPPDTRIPNVFTKTARSSSAHDSLKAKMQKLRGRLYVQDGAIKDSDLSADGRHILPSDDRSWHLLTMGIDGEVLGCTRYTQHGRGTHFEELGISQTALAHSDAWGARMRAAVEEELAVAEGAGFSFVEVGGWAMAEQVRCTAECLRSVLATYAWSRLVGGAIGISSATERNGSASILRRLGGESLVWDDQEIPSYYDPHYSCQMQMLRYDSRRPTAKYDPSIESIRETLSNIPVICAERPVWKTIFRGFANVSHNSGIATGMLRQVA